MIEVAREERCPYFRCPSCGLIGEPDSADYCLAADRGHVDWSKPVVVVCGSCRAQARITQAEVLGREAEHACSRCGFGTACPSDADRVICWGCGLNEPGPGAAGNRATYMQDVEHGANQWAGARLRVAKSSARAHGALPDWAS